MHETKNYALILKTLTIYRKVNFRKIIFRIYFISSEGSEFATFEHRATVYCLCKSPPTHQKPIGDSFELAGHDFYVHHIEH